MTTLEIEDQQVQATVDTGATITILSDDFYQEAGKEP